MPVNSYEKKVNHDNPPLCVGWNRAFVFNGQTQQSIKRTFTHFALAICGVRLR